MRIANIKYNDIVDGNGVCVSVWFQGCPYKCKGCHNPETWDPNSGSDDIETAFKLVCEELDHEWVSGLTLSGGDPLYPANVDEVTTFVKRIRNKYPNKTIWLYTGFTYDKVKYLEIMDYIDVLVDGKFVKELADVNYPWAGSTNQRVIKIANERRKEFSFSAC